MWTTRAGLLVGYGVDDAGPYIDVDDRGADDRSVEDGSLAPWRRHRLRPLAEELHMRVQDERFCTGRYDLDGRRAAPCPERRALPDARFSQCFECREATGFNPAFYNAQDISPQQRRRNALPHFVYLAHFGGGVLKVGISYARRGLGRLLEQGARMALILARCDDAYAAREIEAEVAALGAAETVRASRKRKLLATPFREQPARRELLAMVERIAELRPEVEQEPELLRLDARYGEASMFERAPTDLTDQRPLELHGRCLGLCGDILVVDGLGEQAGQHFMCSLGELVGSALELSDRPGRNRVHGQMNLLF